MVFPNICLLLKNKGWEYITSIPYDIETWLRTLTINSKCKIYLAHTLSKEHRRNRTHDSSSLFSVSERPHDMLLSCFYYGNVGFLISSKPVDIIVKSICCTGRPIWSYSRSFHSNSELIEAKQKRKMVEQKLFNYLKRLIINVGCTSNNRKPILDLTQRIRWAKTLIING